MRQVLPHGVKDHRLVEKLTKVEHELVSDVLSSDALSKDWPRAWAEVADDRLALARAHLAAAEWMATSCRDGCWDPGGRSVISRAYYAMFCAARAAVSLESNADENDHRKLPGVLGRTTTLGSADERGTVVGALYRFRGARNDADYSAYYPKPLEDDATAALGAARQVLDVCQQWVDEIKRKRGLQ